MFSRNHGPKCTKLHGTNQTSSSPMYKVSKCIVMGRLPKIGFLSSHKILGPAPKNMIYLPYLLVYRLYFVKKFDVIRFFSKILQGSSKQYGGQTRGTTIGRNSEQNPGNSRHNFRINQICVEEIIYLRKKNGDGNYTKVVNKSDF